MSAIPHDNIVERLFASFLDLERAIAGARESLQKRESVPQEIFKRLDSYGGILEKQRRLAHSLAQHLRSGDAVEVARHVTIINGLSGMIIEDAKAILVSLSEESKPATTNDEANFC